MAASGVKTNSLPVRERLLNAAERVAARSGVIHLTLEAVAREAGVSKGGLLYHFPSKSALISGVVERLAGRFEAEQQQVLKSQGSAPGAFTRAYLAVGAGAPDPEQEPIHTALLAAAGTDPHYLDPLRQRFAEWQARLEDDGIDPVTASIVRLAIDGLCLCKLLRLCVPEGAIQQQVLDRLLAMTRPPE